MYVRGRLTEAKASDKCTVHPYRHEQFVLQLMSDLFAHTVRYYQGLAK